MALLTATNGNVTVAAGDLTTVPDGAWTAAVVFRRAGTTTDGFETLMALETAANQIITNLGLDATSEPYAVSCGQGGATRTFAGFDDLADDDAYLFVAIKADGTVDPEANLYRLDAVSPAWDGWVTGTGGGSFENRADVIGRGRLLNQQGSFPLNGGVWVGAWWNVALTKADVTDAAAGLHIGVQQWLDINSGSGLVALWRPGETDPVADESPTGTADETASSGVTIVAEDPTGFDMAFGSGGATGTIDATLPALTGELDGAATATADLAGMLPPLTADLSASASAAAALDATLPALTADLTGSAVDTATGTLAGTLPALTGSLAGSAAATGALAGTLPLLSGSFDLTATASAVLTAALPMLTAELVEVAAVGTGPRITASTPVGRITASTPPRTTTTSTSGGRL